MTRLSFLSSRAVRSIVIGATLFVCLHAFDAAAQGQNVYGIVSLACKQSITFNPGLNGDRTSTPKSANPTVATAGAGRVGTGGAGQIEITAGDADGSTIVTYGMKDFSGNQFTVTITVVVHCHDIPTHKQAEEERKARNTPKPEFVDMTNRKPRNAPIPAPVYPKPPAVPTHREPKCDKCKDIAKELNDASDKLSSLRESLLQAEGEMESDVKNLSSLSIRDYSLMGEWLIHHLEEDQAKIDSVNQQIQQTLADIKALTEKLNACEATCSQTAVQTNPPSGTPAVPPAGGSDKPKSSIPGGNTTPGGSDQKKPDGSPSTPPQPTPGAKSMSISPSTLPAAVHSAGTGADSHRPVPRPSPEGIDHFNIFGGYSYTSGWERNFNGGEVSFLYSFLSHLGVFGDYAYFTSGANTRMSYLAGPRFTQTHGKWAIFGDAGFGAVRGSSVVSTTVTEVVPQVVVSPSLPTETTAGSTTPTMSTLPTTTSTPTATTILQTVSSVQTKRVSSAPFAMKFGGGLEVTLSRHVALRLAQVDDVITRFGGRTQNSLQVSTGLVVHF